MGKLETKLAMFTFYFKQTKADLFSSQNDRAFLFIQPSDDAPAPSITPDMIFNLLESEAPTLWTEGVYQSLKKQNSKTLQEMSWTIEDT